MKTWSIGRWAWIVGLAVGCGGQLCGGQRPQIQWLAGGHPFGASAVSFLADGRLLSGGADLKVWDVQQRRLERTLSRARVGADTLALGPGQAWVATTVWSPERAVVLHRLPEGVEWRRLPLGDLAWPVMRLSASPEGEWLLGASMDSQIYRWHVPTGAALPPGELAAFWPGASGVELWAGVLVTSNEMVATAAGVVFRAQFAPPTLLWDRAVGMGTELAVSADRRWVAVSETNRVVVLDARTGETVRELQPAVPGYQRLAFSPDGSRLVGTDRNLPVSVWRMTDGALELSLPGLTQAVTGLAISEDGRLLAVSHARGIALWDLESRQGPEELTALPSIVRSLGVSTNGLVAVGTGWGDVAVFDLATGQRLALGQAGGSGRALALAPSGQWVATDGPNDTLNIYRLPGLALERSLRLPNGINRVELSARGERLAVGPWEGGPMVLRTADWTIERSFELSAGDWLRGIRLSPDGRRLAAVTSDRTVRVWDVDTGAVVGTLGPEYSGAMEWDDAGTRLWLLSGTGRVTRWNVGTGEIEYDRPLALEGASIVRVLWLPDRSAVLLSLADVGLELWRLDRAQRVVRFDEEVGRSCLAMAFDPDKRLLLLGRYDGTLAVAGLPFFLDVRAAGPAQVVVRAQGPVGPVGWQTRTEGGEWRWLAGQDGKELILSTSEPHQWVRAVLVR